MFVAHGENHYLDLCRLASDHGTVTLSILSCDVTVTVLSFHYIPTEETVGLPRRDREGHLRHGSLILLPSVQGQPITRSYLLASVDYPGSAYHKIKGSSYRLQDYSGAGKYGEQNGKGDILRYL